MRISGRCSIIILLILFSLSSCQNMIDSELIVYNWTRISDGKSVWLEKDPYGISYKDYRIFYTLDSTDIIASYYSTETGESSRKVKLHYYKNDYNHNFISVSEKMISLSSPFVYGKEGMAGLYYYDDYKNVLFLSVIKIDNKEYQINDEASKEIWNVLKQAQANKRQNAVDNIKLKNSKEYVPIYLYLSGAKAAIRIALLCESIDGKLFLSNFNYSKFYPMPEKYTIQESFDSALEGILETANAWNN